MRLVEILLLTKRLILVIATMNYLQILSILMIGGIFDSQFFEDDFEFDDAGASSFDNENDFIDESSDLSPGSNLHQIFLA